MVPRLSGDKTCEKPCIFARLLVVVALIRALAQQIYRLVWLKGQIRKSGLLGDCEVREISGPDA